MGRRKLSAEEQEESKRKRARNQKENNRRKLLEHDNFNPSIYTEHYAGSMDVLCIHCNAKHFEKEKVSNKGLSFHDCCNHGLTILDDLPECPADLQKLFDINHNKSNEFFNNIRGYNCSFSFASINANLVNLRSQRPGPYCFKIQGQIYYQINTSLYPEPNDTPTYGQLFIVDPNESYNCRLQRNTNFDLELTQILDKTFREHNVFAKSYNMLKEEVENQQASSPDGSIPELEMHFTLTSNLDKRRYNSQRTNEVAAIFSTEADGEIPDSYVVIRNKNTRVLKYVSTMDANVEPWIYPLFYPYGSVGWHTNLKNANGKSVTRSAYIRYRMALRDNKPNNFVKGRNLFQQWLVDNYVKVEKDKITYCQLNQKQICSDSYKSLKDFLDNQARQENARVGKMVILPSTFIGSPRYMEQLYQDAMAIIRKKGKPDLFITMTCNPNWREIQENLLPGQKASDRPDICSRVFNIKKQFLIDLITKYNIFGAAFAHLHVIEFQKRSLPHVHMLVVLQQEYKLTTAEKVNRFISAEIPNPTDEPVLHEIVIRNMIHGPCGDWCLKNGKCSKHFPKDFQEETLLNGDGYPNYRRRNTGITYERPGNHTVDNRWVVPYCPELSMRLNCHINVEVVSSVSAVKYMCKYFTKGHDAASLVITTITDGVVNHDEPTHFVDTRYVGPNEAYWRITNKKLQDKSHLVNRLPVHLPNQQNIVLQVDADDDQLLECLNQTTKLLDYFALNRRDDEAKQFLYSDIPEHYTFKKVTISGKETYRWEKRKSHFNVIGRMHAVSPTLVETYYLRLLLLRVKGAISFDDLKTVNGIQYETFGDACLALGIIENDEEWRNALKDGQLWMMPKQMRQLFVRLLIHCQPQNPENLWEEFKISMSQDYARKYNLNLAIQKAYADINKLLCLEGHNLTEFPRMIQLEQISNIEKDITAENALKLGYDMYEKLNVKQKEIVDLILSILNNPSDFYRYKCFFIDGPGGSGKTYLYTTLYYLTIGHKKNVSTMAFTGIAATLLPHGKTVHKTLGLPVPLYADSNSSIKLNSLESETLKNTDVFVWDESPMAPRFSLEIFDRLLQEIMNNNQPFGGKIVVMGGDFRQLPPVNQNGTRNETINLSIKFSKLWVNFKVFSLIQNMRTLASEVEFSKFLIELGNGSLNDFDNNVLLPDNLVSSNNMDIVDEIYGSLIKNKQYDTASQCAILSARNVDVDELNQRVVNLLDENTERIYTSVDTVDDCDNGNDLATLLLPEYLNTLNPPSLSPYELRLRLYSVVMLIRNLNINEGLCNGTRLLVIDFSNTLLKCKILTGDKQGEIVFINRITLYCNEYPFTFKRRQFPIKLAFAMTINKAQGQTFNKIGIDLRKDVFQHGQLYVACSRVRRCEDLKIFLDNAENDNKTVKNYVYPELLL